LSRQSTAQSSGWSQSLAMAQAPLKPLLIAASGLGGVVLGVCISVVVNVTLVEISLSPFFSLYFGLLFIVVGGLILWRVSGHEQVGDAAKKTQLSGFAVLIIASGVLCFLLDRNWFGSLSAMVRVPLYSVLGLSVAFALTFSIVDVVNWLMGFCQVSQVSKPLVESGNQVNLVLAVSLMMGLIFGFIFGAMDVPDAAGYQIRISLMREENYCYPIGAVLGGLAGCGNEYFRQIDDYRVYEGVSQQDFDDDI